MPHEVKFSRVQEDSIPFFWKTTCHTCKLAKSDFEDRGIKIRPIDITKEPPSKRVLKDLVSRYGARNMIRRNSKDYKQLGVGKMQLSDKGVVDLLHAHPDLSSRPIVVTTKGVFLSKDERLREILKPRTFQ